MKNYFLIFCLSLFINGWSQKMYSDVKNPSEIEVLTINCDSDDFNDFIKKGDQFNNLKILTIVNYNNVYFPEELKQISFLSLRLVNSPNVDLPSLFNLLSSNILLKELVLDNNEVKKVSANISQLKSLERLSVKNNEELDIANVIRFVKALPKLKAIDLSSNFLSVIPENISLLKTLKTLNISNNNIKELPNSIAQLVNLDSLMVQSNLLENPFLELEKLKNIDLKYLLVDEFESKEEREKIKQLFTETIIEEQNELNFDFSSNFLENGNGNQEKYGEISIQAKQFKAYSNAYYHYAKIFNNRRFKYTFDSLMFNERYLDTTYANQYKLQDFVIYDRVNFYKEYKLFSKDICFRIYPKSSSYFYKMYPELRAFGNMNWYYKGPLNKKQFKKSFIKEKEWTDIRVYYDDVSKDFTIQLKSRSGFEDISAYPLLMSRKNNEYELIEAQKRYLKQYIRYSKTLDSRKKHFHIKLARDKRRYESNLKKSIDKTWRSFQKLYMSAEERKMTKKEWLIYYDNVIANEKSALFSSSANIRVIARSLDIEKYYYNDFNRLIDNGYFTVSAYFVNEQNKTMPIKSFLLIDVDNRSYYKYEGNLGIDLQSVFVNNSSVAIIAEYRNGDIGYITKADLLKQKLQVGNEYAIPLKTIGKDLSSVGQLYKLLDL